MSSNSGYIPPPPSVPLTGLGLGSTMVLLSKIEGPPIAGVERLAMLHSEDALINGDATASVDVPKRSNSATTSIDGSSYDMASRFQPLRQHHYQQSATEQQHYPPTQSSYMRPLPPSLHPTGSAESSPRAATAPTHTSRPLPPPPPSIHQYPSPPTQHQQQPRYYHPPPTQHQQQQSIHYPPPPTQQQQPSSSSIHKVQVPERPLPAVSTLTAVQAEQDSEGHLFPPHDTPTTTHRKRTSSRIDPSQMPRPPKVT